MTRSNCSFVLALLLLALSSPTSSAAVFNYSGEMFFCTTVCDAFGALGGQTGGSNNQVNSTVSGMIDIPLDANGMFSISPADNVQFAFSIVNAALPMADPVFGPSPTCPPPNVAGQICNPGTVNPLPLDNFLATVEGFGQIDASGNLVSGTLDFVFTVPPFSNNAANVAFDLSTGDAEGFVFDGAILFTRVSGEFSVVPVPAAVWLFGSALLGFLGLRTPKDGSE